MTEHGFTLCITTGPMNTAAAHQFCLLLPSLQGYLPNGGCCCLKILPSFTKGILLRPRRNLTSFAFKTNGEGFGGSRHPFSLHDSSCTHFHYLFPVAICDSAGHFIPRRSFLQKNLFLTPGLGQAVSPYS